MNISWEGEALSVLLDEVCSDGVVGRSWDEESFERSCRIPWSKLKGATCQFTHYVGPYEFTHSNPESFLISELLNTCRFWILRNQVEQFFFNHRRLARAERMTALRLILQRTLADQNYQTSGVGFLTELHSDRALFHPNSKQHISYCTLLLDSLVESGDLQKADGMRYGLSPKALLTVASYEEEDRRHGDSLRQQRALSWLTLALVAVGAIQLVLLWAK